ncbi:MAG TPA: hypothetical protein VGJ84_12885 [Polyangiaceae bacterium]|jgi:hypothetical protein
MSSNAVFFGWNRSTAGREKLSNEHFADFLGFLGKLQSQGTITGFEPVFLAPHGGELNGFFLIRGEPSKLSVLLDSDEWLEHTTRALMHLDNSGYVRAYVGDAVQTVMNKWQKYL